MPKYLVTLSGMVHASVCYEVESEDKEDAEDIARSMVSSKDFDIDYHPHDLEVFEVEEDEGPDELTENQDFARDDDLSNLEASDIL